MKVMLSSVLISIGILTSNFCINYSNSNEAYLYYMDSNEEGHFFLEPTHEENIVFVSNDDSEKIKINELQLYKGKKFIGVFDDVYKWELLEIRTINYEE